MNVIIEALGIELYFHTMFFFRVTMTFVWRTIAINGKRQRFATEKDSFINVDVRV